MVCQSTRNDEDFVYFDCGYKNTRFLYQTRRLLMFIDAVPINGDAKRLTYVAISILLLFLQTEKGGGFTI